MLAIVVSIGNIRSQSIDEWYLDSFSPQHDPPQKTPDTPVSALHQGMRKVEEAIWEAHCSGPRLR